MRSMYLHCGIASFAVIVAAQCAVAAELPGRSDEGVEFYEKRVRPLLVENCYQCHGPNKQRAGLRLDSPRAVFKGGDRGPAIQPRDPDHSLLVRAVRYSDEKLRMPPRGKLTDQQISDLIRWVEMGAPGPNDDDVHPIETAGTFDLAQRRKHWAYEPVRAAALPSLATTPSADSPIDLFILARLEELGIPPAKSVNKRTLLRRVTFDLTGLPPEPEEVESFLGDASPDAFAKVVDRLLASPQYGERWGRHWLDLVRYAETLAFEFDYDLYNAWRYRDYVIRAWNDDLPFNRFFVEHLAGDLVSDPRYDPIEGFNESILATGFFWMGEGKQTPVDIRQEQADRIDNQIDVLGKAFLGQTIACARCHDHKFDAISTRDYYSLAGYLKSSRYQQAFIDSPDRNQPQLRQLTQLKAAIGELAASELTAVWLDLLSNADRYLLAAQQLKGAAPEDPLTSVEASAGLNPIRLEKWVNALRRAETAGSDHPFFTWVQLLDHGNTSPEQFWNRRDNLLLTLRDREQRAALSSVETFQDFRQDGCCGWYLTGDAFHSGQTSAGEFAVGPSVARPIARLTTTGVDSGKLSGRLQGELRSQTFTIQKGFVHFRLAGREARINLVIDGNTLIMNPMYGKLTIKTPGSSLKWQTMPVDRWIGHRAYFEISDSTIPMHGLNPPPSTAHVPEGPANGYVALDRVVFSDYPDPPLEAPNQLNVEVLERSIRDKPSTPAELAAAYRDRMLQAVKRSASLLRRSPFEVGSASASSSDADSHAIAPSEDELVLLNWLLDSGLLDCDGADERPASDGRRPAGASFAGLITEFQSIESTLAGPRRAPALADGTGEDECVFLRGNHATLGERVPRRPPEVFSVLSDPSSDPQPSDDDGEEINTTVYFGSGRLALARRLAIATNPLLARVIANRIWQHHFGEGIVRTPDDFGRMGQPPSHPELLDFLAAELVRGSWSLKRLHRRIILSHAYQMSNLADPAAMQLDPENRLLHHMPIRRLEAEAIRDSVLFVSGRLDRSMYGPSVLPHVTPYMEGRGRPNSGPLDGGGRRSIYINARRNFLTPLLLAFDYPVSFSTIGRRGVSTVPAQALSLMNDPFLGQQSEVWAQRVLAEAGPSTQQRIDWLYRIAFARPPSAAEMQEAQLFIENQSVHGRDSKAWADLCHVLMNVKEFIFVE